MKFKKYANWISKSDPDLMNTIDEILPNGMILMTDGEEYTEESLMGTHSYIPVTMEFKDEIMHGEGVDPEAREQMERQKQTFGLDLALDHQELVSSGSVNLTTSDVFPLGNIQNTTGGQYIPLGGQHTFVPQPVNNLWNTAVVADPTYTALKQMCKVGESYELPNTGKLKMFLELFNISDSKKIEELFKQLFKEPEIIEAIAIEYSNKMVDALGIVKKQYGPVDSILTKVGDTVSGHNIVE